MNLFKMAQSLLDIILPRRERTMRAEILTITDLHIAPSAESACGIEITTLMDYRSRAVEDCVRALKYDGSASATTLLAEALGDYLREEIAHIQIFSTKKILLVPMPLHTSRIRERGFIQIELVLAKLPDEFKNGILSTLATGVLARTRATPPQTRLSRRERLTNVLGAFVAVAEKIRGTHIFLIDDVTTTGATLAEAAKTLEKAGSIVSAISLARA